MLTTVHALWRHVTRCVSCDRIFNSCGVHEPCPWCVLADGCLTGRGGGARAGRQTRRCKMVGRGWTQLQIEADGYVRGFNQIQSLSLHHGTQGSAGWTASSGVGAHTVQAGRQPATLLSLGHNEKERKKKSQRLRGNAALRGTVYPCRFHSLR